MTTTSKPRARYTETAIITELVEASRALGHFPARAEHVRDGKRSLWDAMKRINGDVGAWRQRVEAL